MLIPLMYLLKPADAFQRFHDFLDRTKAFSVQITAHSDSVPNATGKGAFALLKPSYFKLSMNWGSKDYSYVKTVDGSVDFERYDRIYQEYPQAPGLLPTASAFSGIQEDSVPIPLLTGDLMRYVDHGVAYKLTSSEGGNETYTAVWKTGTSGRVVVTIAQDGRLLHFDDLLQTPTGSIHRIMDFSNYSLTAIPTTAFSLIPPLGFTSSELPPVKPTIAIGDVLTLGKWKSSVGVQTIDSQIRGKLVIVREQDSLIADALVSYLAKHKLPLRTVVVSVGRSGGQFWAPSTEVAARLSSAGTPLTMLVDNNGKISAMWLGFDREEPGSFLSAITSAAKGKSDE
jgi:hypothetical protein